MHRLLRLTLILALLLPPLAPAGARAAGPLPQNGTVMSVLARMTPAEKVGQLFLATFYGPSAAAGSEVGQLITEYHVGGVMLLAANDNFTDSVDAPRQALTLTNQLQSITIAAAVTPREVQTDAGVETGLPPYVPLLVAVSQDERPFLSASALMGMTDLPEALAIGATWDPAQAQAMGRVLGRELSAVGINMLLGPSLDVLDEPRPQGLNDLGPYVFGGDPFWVGAMGQAFVRGLHAGSEGRLAVVAKHFPGLGSSDRDPAVDQDVPTVHRVLEQLEQTEMVPFLAVTSAATDTAAIADGLLTTHIRYVGFQGNPRQSTNPISFDQQALGQLLALPELTAWRAQGGVLVSESLGARAIKRFFDPSERTFNNKRIAREAFAAGNDLLLLSQFGRNPAVDQFDTIVDTLVYFTQQYEADPVFAERVDASVIRVLSLKLRLYGRFDSRLAVLSDEALAQLPPTASGVQALAQLSATLMDTAPDETVSRAPEPPVASDRIVFFTDARAARICSACPAEPYLDRRALERAVLRLYGPEGSAQVRESNLQSFSFEELAAALAAAAAAQPPGPETPTPEPAPVEAALANANWIVFSLLNVTPNVAASGVIKTFLKQRPELARSKKIIAFAFSAPYYLDATDVSKLSAYYALYSRAPAFVDAAARLLFRDLVPRGAPPVSVESIGYEIARATAPDPTQLIGITSDKLQGNVGDTIQLSTSVIHDLNGQPVPDGTPVRFLVQYKDDVLPALLPAATRGGVASTALTLNRIGQVEIRADSEPARASIALQINVQQGTPFVITVIAPTQEPSATPSPTVTPSPTPTLQPTPEATPASNGDLSTPPRVAGRDFFMLCLLLAATVAVGYRLGGLHPGVDRRMRVALAGALGALAGYNFFALSLPGADLAVPVFGIWAASAFVWLGAVSGLAAGWYLWVRRP